MQDLLSRKNSQVLRGVAMLFIMLHNYLHIPRFGFSKENEMSFSLDKTLAFWDSISAGSNWVGEFLSHLGWIAMPVFVFLTGYGIAMRPAPSGTGEPASYVKRHYLKLLALLLPAVLFFLLGDILKGVPWPDLLKRVSYLTMMANVAYPFVSCSPGVYWYFGLTFQYYLLWALFGRRFTVKNMFWWSVASIAGLFGFSLLGSSDALSIYRHCFTGWFPVFAIGVCLGLMRGKDWSLKLPVWGELLAFVVLTGLILLMDRWLVSWLFIPIVALALFLVIGRLLLRTRFLSGAFGWIGSLSACLFVCHPMARTLVLNFLIPRFSNLWMNLAVYFILSFGMALLYRFVYKWLLSAFQSKKG